MNINKKAIFGVVCLSFLGLGHVSAKVMQIHFNEGQPLSETELSLIDKITFTETGFSLQLTDNATESYGYGKVEKITFSDFSSIAKIGTESNLQLLISPNPVDDIIRIIGYDSTEPVQLSIYSLDGEEVMRVDNWQGEPIDASLLSAGIYILRINTTTIKFIKS